MKEKIKSIIQSISESVKPKLNGLDLKFQGLIPNPKLRKILYYGVGGLFGFMFLLILLGLLLSPFRSKNTSNNFSLVKPKIEISSPTPQRKLNDTQKQILNLKSKIDDLKFPESILTIPTIESDLHI